MNILKVTTYVHFKKNFSIQIIERLSSTFDSSNSLLIIATGYTLSQSPPKMGLSEAIPEASPGSSWNPLNWALTLPSPSKSEYMISSRDRPMLTRELKFRFLESLPFLDCPRSPGPLSSEPRIKPGLNQYSQSLVSVEFWLRFSVSSFMPLT